MSANKRRLPSGAKVVFRGRVFNVARVLVANAAGGPRLEREIVCHGPSVVIVARDRAGRILFERQYRAAIGASLWELPAGGVEPGESALAAARRELTEETGYTARRWRRLGSFYSSPGFVDEELHVFLAAELLPGPPRREPDEQIRLRWLTLADLRSWQAARRLHDAKSLAALALSHAALTLPRRPPKIRAMTLAR